MSAQAARPASQEDGQNQSDEQQAGQQDQRPARTLAEWVTFGVASALLLGVAGLVLYLWLGVPQTPPAVTVSPSGDILKIGEQYYVPFTVRNGGGGTADAVQVHAELRIDDEVVEEGEQLFDFLSGGESEEGTFVFDHDPGAGELTMGVGSFKLP